MAIYLGNQRVSPSLLNIITRTITQDASGNTISDVIQETAVTHEDPANRTEDLPVITNEWSRPSTWPNIDNLPVLTEGLYLTYDNTSAVDYKWAAFRVIMNTGNVIIEQGHLNGSNFVRDATWTVASNTVKEINYSSSAYEYVIFKITPASTNHILEFYFNQVAQASVGTLVLKPQQSQRCLERRGWLPYFRYATGSGDNYRYCTEWIERDCVQFGDSVTSLAALWYRGRSLQKIEFGNWTGANCNITSLASAFEQCNVIEKIDLSQWITTNWHVTTINSMFYCCYNMKICILPFDTTSWGSGSGRTLTLSSTWCNCHTLENLDLSSWNMTGINVTTLYSTWQSCYHLKSLNVKNWDTSSWVVTSLYCTFYYCRRLVDIDLSGWDTSKWVPTRMDNMFLHNHLRHDFNDIKYWDTSKWKIAQFNDAFGSCYTVQELDLSNWDVSGWVVTTLSNTFGSMYSVRHIRVGNWNTTNWKVTNINYLCCNDYNLEELECLNWNTSNWPVTNGPYAMFQSCLKIKEADLTSWDTSKWNLSAGGKSDLRYWFQYCYSLKKINVSNFDVNAVNSLSYYSQNAAGSRSYSPFYACYSLEELTLPTNYKGHIDLSDMYKLPRSEFIKAVNALGTPIANTAKVWIVNTKYKLTTADIAIATNKGYTVVQS